MARRIIVVDLCERCPIGKEREATVTRRFALDGNRYKIKLCDQHSSMLDRDMGAWTTLADDDDTRDAPLRSVVTPEQLERDRRAAERRAKQAPAIVPRPAPEPEALPFAEDVPLVEQLHWRLTPHAHERATEREVPVHAAIAAASRPKQVVPTQGPAVARYGEGTEARYRDDYGVIVDPIRKVIITVLPKRGSKHDDNLGYVKRAAARG